MLKSLLLSHCRLQDDEMICVKYGEGTNTAEVALSSLCRVWTILDDKGYFLVMDLGNYGIRIPEENVLQFSVYKVK